MGKTTTSWKPGQSGNPAGRPKGTKDAINKAFLEDVTEDWRECGKEALERARKERPAEYVRMVASLLPKDQNLNVVTSDDALFHQVLELMNSDPAKENARLKAEIAALKGEAPRVIDREARELSAVPISGSRN